MNKLLSLLALFRQGAAVTDPQLWKERQITATLLAGVILALVNALSLFGVSLPIDPESANAIAAGFIAVVNVVLTLTTSTTVGLAPKETSTSTTSDSEIKHKEEYEKFLRQSN